MENNESIQPKEEPKEEPMETDQNDINLSEIKKEIEEETKQEAQTEIKKEVEAESETKQEAQPETKVNGVHLNGTEEKSKPGSFRLKVTGLPKFYPVAVKISIISIFYDIIYFSISFYFFLFSLGV